MREQIYMAPRYAVSIEISGKPEEYTYWPTYGDALEYLSKRQWSYIDAGYEFCMPNKDIPRWIEVNGAGISLAIKDLPR